MPVLGIEWVVQIDRAEAAKYHADVANIGSTVQLMTSGILLGDYRPSDSDEEIELRLRFPKYYRHLDTLDNLMVNTNEGLVPISYFVKRTPDNKVNKIQRQDGMYMFKVEANPAPGKLPTDLLKELQPKIQP